MNSQQISMLAGAFRAVLAGLLGYFVTHGYINSDFLNAALLFVGTAGIVVWSYLDKQGNATDLFPALMGPARNFAVVALTYAAGRGWIDAKDIAGIMGGAAVIAAALWSMESKYLSVRRIAPVLICCALALPMLVACADVATPQGALDAAHDLYVAAETGYTATCVAYPTFPICTADDQAKAKQAEALADAAFTTAQDAINARSLSDTAIMKLINDFIQDAAVIEGLFNQGEQMKAAMHPTVWYRVMHPATWHS